jgi:dihydroorotate dehydrogenase electron transfer subunit
VVFHFYNCGPELMERAAFTLEQRFPRTGIETSVERYMKCGIGVCGVCALDGWRTCVDGPVLDEKRLAESRHFGCCHRTKSGHLEAFSSGSHGSPAGLASDPCPGPGTPPPSRSR